MAQGAIKKKAKTTPSSSKRKSILAPKPGAKVIAPKKKTLVDAKKMTKKLSAGLTAQTERTLAERAGHLEMLGGGKNAKNAKKGGRKGDGKDGKGDGKGKDGKGKKT